MKKNAVVGQSGGPTAVINASLYGTVYEALNREDEIGTVYGMINGIENDHCGSIGTLYPRRADLSQGQKPEEVIQRGGGFAGPPLYISQKRTKGVWF